MFLKRIFKIIEAAVKLTPHYGSGTGQFDSLGGTYDTQTTKSFFKRLYYEMRSRSIIGKLARVDAQTGSLAGGEGYDLAASSIIGRQKIDDGDELLYTMQEYLTGMGSYGDMPVVRGDFLAWQNMKARVNAIDSPAFPIQGKMAQQRVATSLTDLPAKVREAATFWMNEQYEHEYILANLNGASPSVLLPTSSGGLGHVMGVNTSGSAGTPLMNRHWYTPQGGLLTYSTTPATWNSTVNTAINAITAGANGYISLVQIKIIHAILDTLNFPSVRLGGTEYRAVWLCDSELWERIDHLLATAYASSRERAAINPLFTADHQLVYKNFLFLNVPHLNRYRAAYNGTTLRPDFGPNMTSDPRTYTNTSDLAMALIVTRESVIEGFNDSLNITTAVEKHKKGSEICAHMDSGFVRCEWFAKDGRTSVDAVKNYASLHACFYEPGVGTGY